MPLSVNVIKGKLAFFYRPNSCFERECNFYKHSIYIDSYSNLALCFFDNHWHGYLIWSTSTHTNEMFSQHMVDFVRNCHTCSMFISSRSIYSYLTNVSFTVVKSSSFFGFTGDRDIPQTLGLAKVYHKKYKHVLRSMGELWFVSTPCVVEWTERWENVGGSIPVRAIPKDVNDSFMLSQWVGI